VETPISMITDKAVCSVKPEGRLFEVDCINKYHARAVIIASGKRPGLLNVKGEKEFLGRGIAYCSICDAPLYAGRDVVVAGGGNSALGAALDLAAYAAKIYLVNNTASVAGDAVLQDRVRATGKVEIIPNSSIKEINGDTIVRSVTIETGIERIKRVLQANGVFIEIGWKPASDFLEGVVDLNEAGEVIIDRDCCTSVPGICACGDVTNIREKQIIIACGEGAKAALSVYRYLNGLQ
jgi:alkyl hydroperoxide reductase subunit F